MSVIAARPVATLHMHTNPYRTIRSSRTKQLAALLFHSFTSNQPTVFASGGRN